MHHVLTNMYGKQIKQSTYLVGVVEMVEVHSCFYRMETILEIHIDFLPSFHLTYSISCLNHTKITSSACLVSIYMMYARGYIYICTL